MSESFAQVAAEQVAELLAQARTRELPLNPGIPTDRAEALVAEIRAGREAR